MSRCSVCDCICWGDATTLSAATVSSASFQATFVVHEACTVVSQRGRTQVRCQHNTPYLLQQQATPSDTGLITVTF